MTKLADSIKEIKGQIEIYLESRESATEAKDYENILKKIQEIPHSMILNRINEIDVLASLQPAKSCRSLNTQESECLASAAASLESLSDHWQKEGANARQGNFLADFVTSAKALNDSLQKSNEQTWIQSKQHLESRFATEEHLIKAQLQLEQTAVDRAKRFMQLKRDFEEITRKLPQTRDEIQRMQSLAGELETLLGEMNFDVPEVVSAFMLAVKDGAPISLLTDEVINYLKNTQSETSFVVVRKGPDYGR
mgnify:CR=1 FL=1